MRRIRPILTTALEQLATSNPKTVALDVILSDKGDDTEDTRLEAALHDTRNLILPCELVGSRWEDPLPRFASSAVALGHVHPEENRADGVSRELSLEETGLAETGHGSPVDIRRWALALEAFRVFRGEQIIESPDDVEIGATIIPAGRANGPSHADPLSARGVPTVSALRIRESAGCCAERRVFLGMTALSAARDRLVNPYGENVPGVEVHAHAFETMARGNFLQAGNRRCSPGLSALFAAGAGLAFALLPGWMAYARGDRDSADRARVLPVFFFRQGVVFPYFAPGRGGVAVLRRRGHLSALLRAPATGAQRIGAIALPAGDPLGRARNAHAADRDSRLQRDHEPLQPAGGEAQSVERHDQLRIQAPGAHHSNVSRRRTPGRRSDGAEARAVRGRRNGGRLHEARDAAGRAQADRDDAGQRRSKERCWATAN